MTASKSLFASIALQLVSLALAAGATSPRTGGPGRERTAPQSPDADRYARRCQGRASGRELWPAAAPLWGTKQGWSTLQAVNERASVLVSVDLEHLLEADAEVQSLRSTGGHLEAVPDASASLVGTVLQGTDSNGQRVEVALCGAEPAPEDHDVVWYRLEAWNPVARHWENPCAATGPVPDPRAVAVRGGWDARGEHHDLPGKLTFACENGAISRCIRWGYKPWAQHAGRALADVHQACTRMARADYCGNGRSHARPDTAIDLEDSLGMNARAREPSPSWDPARASFEAAWGRDGAFCLARTRDGSSISSVLQECPGRFQTGVGTAMSDGQRCAALRVDASPGPVLLRNRSYAAPQAP